MSVTDTLALLTWSTIAQDKMMEITRDY